jgi:hypothetical protein
VIRIAGELVGAVPFARELAVDADEPKRLLNASISSGSASAGELTDIFSAPALRTSSASATERIPPATQNGMSSTRATRWTQPRSTERCCGLAVMS